MKKQMLLIAILILAAGVAAAQNSTVTATPTATAAPTKTPTPSRTPTATLTPTPTPVAVAPQALVVDPSASARPGTNSPTVSDANDVFEPGETVAVEPGWKNITDTPVSLQGTASSFTGPGEATYTIADSAADYGTIAAGASSSCSSTSNCYLMSVSAPATRPSTHWDTTFTETPSTGDVPKVWMLHIGDSFTDVPRSQPFYRKIETLLHNGITYGCTTTQYCPTATVSRGQMAIFIAKAIAGSGANVPVSGTANGKPYNCTSGGVSIFTDVLPTDVFCRHAHYLAAQNVTLGCSVAEFCPAALVNRDGMAGFVAKGIVAPGGGPAVPESYTDPVTGLSYSCDVASPSLHFADVPATDPFCKHIYYLWAKNIVSGCGPASFCSDEKVDRGAMAKFLVNAFQLRLDTPITSIPSIPSTVYVTSYQQCIHPKIDGHCTGGYRTVYSFIPNTIHIFAGETVTWTWTGTHSSTSGTWPTPDGNWDSELTTQGFSHKFTQPGTYPYFCSVTAPLTHSHVRGTVIVDP